MRDAITVHYEEFLNHTKLSSAFNVKAQENLNVLNEVFQTLVMKSRKSDEKIDVIVRELETVKDLGTANRIWLLFHADIIRTQIVNIVFTVKCQ